MHRWLEVPAHIGSPRDVGLALEGLTNLLGRKPEPDEVLAVAKDPHNPLHRWFEWDDTKAAVAHRRHQAKQLLTVCVVTSPPKRSNRPSQARARVSTRQNAKPAAPMARSVDSVLAQGKAALSAWVDSYGHLEHFQPVIEAARAVLEGKCPKCGSGLVPETDGMGRVVDACPIGHRLTAEAGYR